MAMCAVMAMLWHLIWQYFDMAMWALKAMRFDMAIPWYGNVLIWQCTQLRQCNRVDGEHGHLSLDKGDRHLHQHCHQHCPHLCQQHHMHNQIFLAFWSSSSIHHGQNDQHGEVVVADHNHHILPTIIKKMIFKIMVTIFITIITTLIIKMTGGTPEVRSDKRLTLMTFNIRYSTMDQWTNGPMDQWTNGLMD